MRRHLDRCDRAREWVSLAVDGELSRFEHALLETHLKDCRACSVFRAQTAAFTQELRAAPLEPLRRPVVLPRRRHVAFRPLQVSAAALAAIALGLGGLLAATLRSSDSIIGPQRARAFAIDSEVASQKRWQSNRNEARVLQMTTLTRQPGPQLPAL